MKFNTYLYSISFCISLMCTFLGGKSHKPHHHHHNKPHTKKYVIGVHKAGLFSAFLGVLNHLAHCQTFNKIPVVYWDHGSFYYHPHGFNGSYNVWEYYFEPVSHLSYNSAQDKIHATYGQEHAEFYYNALRPATRNKAYALISRYVRIKPQVQQKIDDFFNLHMAGKRTIGIHLRGTDKFKEEEPVLPEKMIEAALANADENTQFLVASDEQRLLDKAIELLQGYTVIYYDCYRSEDSQPLHIRKLKSLITPLYTADDGKGLHVRKQKPSLAQVGEDVLVEVSLLTRCDLFVHTLSNVSAAALYFNPSLPNVLLRTSGGHTSITKQFEYEDEEENLA